MSGHNKWSKIKHKKAKTDAQKGKAFTMASVEIMAAVKIGGPEPDMNPRLRVAIQGAKNVNMPNDNIKRAIERASNKSDGNNFEEMTYEGYGQNGVAILVETLTDNRNRTAGNVKSSFTKGGGNIGEPGSVAWMFNKRALFQFKDTTEDELMEKLIDAGIDDIEANDDDTFDVYADPDKFTSIMDYIQENNIKYESAELTMIPTNTIAIEDEDVATKILNLIERLEDCEDVNKVHANCDISDEILQKLN